MNTVDIFLDLIRIDSPTGDEDGIAKFIQDYLQNLNLKSEIDKAGNVLAEIPGNKKLETLILTAHMDTVEPGRGIRPIIDKAGNITSSGDTILGADNKAGVAGILSVLGQLSPEHHPLELIFTVSEESDNLGAKKLDYKKLRAKKGFSFDTSDLVLGDLVLSAPFYTRFDVSILGKFAHASRPDNAVSVLPELNKILSQIKLGVVTKNTLINIGVINSGFVRNAVPGEVIIKGEVRSKSQQELNFYKNHIKSLFRIVSSKVKVKIDVVDENPGYIISKKEKFVKETIKKLKKMNLKPEIKEVWGCFDANIFAENGIKIINFGYGGKNAHTTAETIKVKDLEKLTKLIKKLTDD